MVFFFFCGITGKRRSKKKGCVGEEGDFGGYFGLAIVSFFSGLMRVVFVLFLFSVCFRGRCMRVGRVFMW